MTIKPILLAGAFALSLPFAASAATVTGDFDPDNLNTLAGSGVVGTSNISDLDGGGTVDFDFEVDPQPRAVSGIGTVRRAGPPDGTVVGLSITFNGVAVTLVDDGNNTQSFSFGPSNFALGEVFTLAFSWEDAASTDNIDFDIELQPVPVPAAGLMLLSVLGGGAFVARRKKKANA